MPVGERVRRLVLSLTGTDVSAYKENVIMRRLRSRVRHLGLGELSAYLDLLETGGAAAENEARDLVASLSVPVSGFFRDRAVFQELEQRVWPAMLGDRSPQTPLRVWSAACSRGQEAYSLAISLRRYAGRRGLEAKLSVLGTDVDEQALAHARRGIYPDRAIEGVPPDVLHEAFDSMAGGQWAVRAAIRRMVRFQRSDLLELEAHPIGVDLISCRNLLIYLRRPVQEKLLMAFHRSLRPGGFLVLGSSETVMGRPWSRFEHMSSALRIYRKPDAPPLGTSGSPDE